MGLKRIQLALKLLEPRQIGFKFFICPLCGPSVIVKFANRKFAVRCLRCGASVIPMALVQVMKRRVPDLGQCAVYEMSSRGALYTYLKREAGLLQYSEYFDDVPPGAYKGNVQCQNVEQLTYEDNAFDVCTSTEVFEHVADDRAGFSEIHRILKTDGLFIFTVPFFPDRDTVERAKTVNGQIKHLLPPAYHGDSMRGPGQVFVFREYGRDIAQRLEIHGFKDISVDTVVPAACWGYSHVVVSAVNR